MPGSSLTPAVWYRHLGELPQAAFCHTPAWARIIRQVWGGETTAILHPTPDGQEALLPLVSRPLAGGLLRWTVSGETGVYGGPLLRAPMPAGAWRPFWRDLVRRCGPLTVFVPPGTDWEAPPHGRSLVCQTHRVTLDGQDPALRYNRGLKARLNKARRLGLQVVEGTDEASVGQYVRLYRDTLGRWGDRTSWPRPDAFFQALRHHGHPQVRLWLAQRDGAPIAGIWVATFGTEAHYLAGATGAQGLAAGGSHLLLDHALHEAATAGCRHFDLGASGGREGLIRFKESFGAGPVPYGEVRLWSPAVRLYWFLKDFRRAKGQDSTRAGEAAAGAAKETTC